MESRPLRSASRDEGSCDEATLSHSRTTQVGCRPFSASPACDSLCLSPSSSSSSPSFILTIEYEMSCLGGEWMRSDEVVRSGQWTGLNCSFSTCAKQLFVTFQMRALARLNFCLVPLCEPLRQRSAWPHSPIDAAVRSTFGVFAPLGPQLPTGSVSQLCAGRKTPTLAIFNSNHLLIVGTFRPRVTVKGTRSTEAVD